MKGNAQNAGSTKLDHSQCQRSLPDLPERTLSSLDLGLFIHSACCVLCQVLGYSWGAKQMGPLPTGVYSLEERKA